MASFEQLYYCKNCKKNVAVNNGKCKTCGSTQLNKTWSTRFRYIEEDGVEKQKRLSGFSTKKEAQDAYLKFMACAKKYERIEKQPKDLIFSDLYDEYKSFIKNQVKDSSYYDFCSKSDIHIKDYFKDYKVKDITPKILLDWQNQINNAQYGKEDNKKPYSFKYKRNLRSYLNAILSFAEKYYNIPNQLRKVDHFKNKNEVKEMQIWTPDEFNAFSEQVSNPIYRAFFYALYYTGARKGEILATTWNDWDLDNAKLNINKSITKKVYGTSWMSTSPKNHSSIRKIKIPQILVDVIKEYKIGRENYQLVFADTKPLADSNIQRIMKDACQKANVKLIRIHDIRHSHASYLLTKGVSVMSVAKRLGHSNIEQTLNTYAHVLPDEEDLLVEMLQKIYLKTV